MSAIDVIHRANESLPLHAREHRHFFPRHRIRSPASDKITSMISKVTLTYLILIIVAISLVQAGFTDVPRK